MEFDNDFVLPKSLRLVPELDTLKETPWQPNEAVVFADVYHPENEEHITYAPRNILKQTISQVSGLDKVES